MFSHKLGHATLYLSRVIALMYDKILNYNSTVENETNKFATELLLDRFDANNIQYYNYDPDEVFTNQNNKLLLEKLKELKLGNKY